VAGLITIEDLIEAIVGNIADEHDEAEADDEPVREPDGSYVVSGSFEISRLRELFQDQFTNEAEATDQLALDLERPEVEEKAEEPKEPISREVFVARDVDQPTALRLPEHYESTTLGGLVSEIAGHIPMRGEVVEEDGLRLEVLASTDRRIDRVRVGLSHPPEAA
jgi:putative hemolysin